jgi:type I restriction enzyme R subunit
LLREQRDDDEDIDLSNIEMTHYRVAKQREQDLRLGETEGEYKIEPLTDLGSGRAKDKKTELLSEILERMNDLFAGEGLTDSDMVNYANTIADKVRENGNVMEQVRNNTPEQAMIGDFPQAVQDAVMDSMGAHQKFAEKLLSDKQIRADFSRLMLDIVIKGLMNHGTDQTSQDV